MEFGLLDRKGLVGSEGGRYSSLVSDSETRNGSSFFKRERFEYSEDDIKSFKVSKNDDLSASKAMLLQQRNPSLQRSNSMFYEEQQPGQMLSFSSPKPEATVSMGKEAGLVQKSILNGSFPYYNNFYSTVKQTGTGLQRVITGIRGPFTPSQWLELEQQALIFKYINANIPVPSNLLISIMRELNPSGIPESVFSLQPNTSGWGSSNLGLASGKIDPEPGRCRRTDGKKWRCSRDAVIDGRYCERHLNRGRQRSRKPVEGRNGQVATGPTMKTMPVVSLSSGAGISRIGVSADGIFLRSASNNLTIPQLLKRDLQLGVSHPSATSSNRSLVNKDNGSGPMQYSAGLHLSSPTMSLNLNSTPFFMAKQGVATPFQESSGIQFGVVSSNSVPNSSNKTTYTDCKNYGSSIDLNGRESQTKHPFRHFIDDWPKNKSDNSACTDQTQLSISIPTSSSNFPSFSCSNMREKPNPTQLSGSHEFNPIQMSLGVGSNPNEQTRRPANLLPISWETSMGGPLGEALNKTNRTAIEYKSSVPAFDFITKGWNTSSQMGSSPTGVLQRTPFGSSSNSSGGSSSREETKNVDEDSFCNDFLVGF
ncbi:hypothetical protein IFM89_020243 [Coptis chinensis]|uniref:Growth-regulating factor n=1 Tax=Coptis chinensis TaxID=261450 RepID=A0A835HM94_9MAGN|nr:hypothetical protein IFM89_020243 [Coptis chinensis]